MINRIKHSINGVDFVPNNKETFTLSASFPDDFGEWENDFTAENKVQLPQEAYLELLRHLNDTGVQQMPTYKISIDGKPNPFFVDLYSNVQIQGSFAEISISAFNSKDNIKRTIDALTFEYLRQQSAIKDSDFVMIPYVVVPDDMGAKMLGIINMLVMLGREAINRTEKIGTRIGNLAAGTIPSVGLGIVSPLGNLVAYGIFLAMDIVVLVLLIIMMKRLIKQAFELVHPTVKFLKAMTVDRLLTISLGYHNIKYESTLKKEFKKITIIPIPVDYQNKKGFELLLNEDDRVLNRGYPTSSDTIPTAGLLIEELCKMFNITPRIGNGILKLNPKKLQTSSKTITLDRNFNDQERKETKIELDLSKIWNTKIISYTNDINDKLLFDNPRGLRTEYKTISTAAQNDELTMIKGVSDKNRINFALGTIKEQTKLDEFLDNLAKVSDKFLNTSFGAKLNNRKGVMAISQEQFSVTKLIYQIGGKQTKDYLSHIGSNALHTKYHTIDDSANSVYRNENGIPIRMNNEQFEGVLEDNLVFLEGEEAEVMNIDYIPESSIANIDVRIKELAWTKNIKSIKVYEE